MTLNYKEFEGYLIDSVPSNFKNASYDLSVGQIIDMDGVVHDDMFSIPSQGMVVIVSNEQVNVDDNVLGYVTIKTSLSQKGIMANNIGLVDPGYKGYLSSVVINYGRSNYVIKKEDTFLRLSFHRFNKLKSKDKKKLGYEVPDLAYSRNRRHESQQWLGDTFLNYSNWVDKVSNEVKTEISENNEKAKETKRTIRRNGYVVAGVIIGILSLAFGSYQFVLAKKESASTKELQKEYSIEIEELRRNILQYNDLFYELNEKYSTSLKDLDDLKRKLGDQVSEIAPVKKGS